MSTQTVARTLPPWPGSGGQASRSGGKTVVLRTASSVFVAAILGLTVFGSSVRAIPPGPGKIAFVSDRDGSPQIYVMDGDGSNAIRLTNGEYYTAPEFSPDGLKIAFKIA